MRLCTATEPSQPAVNRLDQAEIRATIGSIKKLIMVGGVFVVVGYTLILGALVLEFTQFHPAIERFFSTHSGHNLAGGGADRAPSAALNNDLATIHKFPSTLLWMKLGGIGHILVGIFVVLAGIIRALSLMPHRLGYAIMDVDE